MWSRRAEMWSRRVEMWSRRAEMWGLSLLSLNDQIRARGRHRSMCRRALQGLARPARIAVKAVLSEAAADRLQAAAAAAAAAAAEAAAAAAASDAGREVQAKAQPLGGPMEGKEGTERKARKGEVSGPAATYMGGRSASRASPSRASAGPCSSCSRRRLAGAGVPACQAVRSGTAQVRVTP